MEIITREQAIANRLGKYFTGEPCKSGHVVQRYTQSGSCELCIRQSKSGNRDLEQAKLDLKAEKLRLERDKFEFRRTSRPPSKRRDLAPLNIMLHFADVEYFKSVMLASAMLSDPAITAGDLMTNKRPQSSGNRSIHYFQTFQVDHIDLYKLQNALAVERAQSGQDEDHNAWRAEMRRRAEEDALAVEDNGRPERLDA